MICDYIYFNYVYENLLKTVSKLRYDDWYILCSIVREKKKEKKKQSITNEKNSL